MRGLSTLVASAVLAGGLLLGAAPASALDIEGYDIWQSIYGGDEMPEIHVKFDPKADDWTIVASDPIKVHFDFELTVKSTYAIDNNSGVTVFLDNFGDAAAIHSSNPGLMFGDRIQGSLDMSSPGDQTNAFKKIALDVCHTVRTNGGEPDKDHEIQRNYKAGTSLIVGTLAPLSLSQKKDRDVWVQYRVVCEKAPGWQSNSVAGLTTEKGKFKVQSIDLFLTTFQGQETNPNPGTSCKKLKVTVRIETSKSGGPVSYKLWRQPGQPVVKQAMSEFQTNGQFKGRYIIEDSFVETFDKTTYVQYMAEILNDPFGPSTQWKPITIQCNGGFTTGQPQGGGDIIPSFQVTATDLKIISLAGKGCPTKAFVTATFTANKPGTFKYFIGTSLNKNKSGQLEAKKVGNVYRAQETLTVDITQSGKLTAHARPVDFPAASAFASKSYNCTGVDAVGGVTDTVD
jgi:hypothetical protein